jgi:hypothetical protein
MRSLEIRLGVLWRVEGAKQALFLSHQYHPSYIDTLFIKTKSTTEITDVLLSWKRVPGYSIEK